jgi:DtxR family transcriptional regulator, Mn-dependent transcriptional regulator
LKISKSKENYLKAIFHLQSVHKLVTTNELASALRTTPASITDMLKKLKKEKLLIYEPYRGFTLNSKGEKEALQIIRKHRLWEYFLVKQLDFGWSEVHEMAEELEHASNKKLIDRLDSFLNYPRSDPHGDPIPDSEGKFNRQQKRIPLSKLGSNKRATVLAISPQTSEILELLQHKNILIGSQISIRKKFSFDDSLEIKMKNGKIVTISASVAKNIMVNDGE